MCMCVCVCVCVCVWLGDVLVVIGWWCVCVMVDGFVVVVCISGFGSSCGVW